MKLNVLGRDGPLTRLECAEDLTLLEVGKADEALTALLGPDCYAGRVLLSLAGASYIDSAGVGWLILCHKRFRDAGGHLVLHTLPPLVVHVFDILGLGAILNVAPDEVAARRLASGAGPARAAPPAHSA